METEPINQNLWWVIPTKLAGVRKPIESEMNELKGMGIGGIVSVMDDPSNLDMYERIGFPYLWLPVKGGTAPSVDQIASLSQFIQQQNDLGLGVAAHCTSGRKRTGTFLAAYLIFTGKSYDQSLVIVQQANPEVELRDAQIIFLKELANS